MSRAALAALALLLGVGCATPVPDAVPVAPGDPAVAGALEAWRERAESRRGLRAVARLAVDAPGAAADGGDLRLRSKQRLWLARPDRLRVEVLGLLDGAVAVLAVDGERYALLQAAERRVDRGAVYPGLLWDVARVDLSPAEAVALLLGAPGAGPDWELAEAFRVGEALRLVLRDPERGLRRGAELGPAGELRRLDQRDASGALAWEARYADFVELGGQPFAREVLLRSPVAEARVVLREVKLNPPLAQGLFEVAP